MRLTQEKLGEILLPFTPTKVIPYLVEVWEEHPFSLTISAPHASSFGYYRFHPMQGPLIRLNNNLSPSHFTMTYLHEVAHHRVEIRSQQEKKRFAPHGTEWKRAFQHLMNPVLRESVFPDPIQTAIQAHMQNPPASSARDHALTQLFRQEKGEQRQTLADIPVGHQFVFRGRTYQLLARRRSRALCEETTSKQRYLISLLAQI